MVEIGTYIFDLDGTLSDNEHRQYLVRQAPKDWVKFNSLCHLDAPKQPIINIARALYNAGYSLVLFSGRSMVEKDKTIGWLHQHGLAGRFEKIYMRPVGDHRDDCILKKDMLETLPERYKNQILGIFDDRQKVVNFWRELGYTCLQVAPGDF